MPDRNVVSILRDNVQRVREQIAAACARAARDPDDVTLVAVTKYVDVSVIAALLATGQQDLGESRAQALAERATALGGQANSLSAPPVGPNDTDKAPAARWHMIGHLQRNKVKTVLQHTRIIHSVDSLRLIHELHSVAERLDITVDGLIETNISGEASKFGVEPEDLERLLADAQECPRVRLCGLMTMAPLDADAEHARPYFARLRKLLTDLQHRGVVNAGFRHLSMGMSQDYVVAVEEGATLVRVGSALFEGLPRQYA